MEPTTLAVTAGAWAWNRYGNAVVDKANAAIAQRWKKFKWEKAAEAYREKIKTLYGTMQIMGMTEPVPLDDIFADAYMLDRPTAFGRFDIEQLKRWAHEPDAPQNAKRINGLRLVVERRNLFILGKPGAGKTTFLKYIALKASEHLIDKVPIFVSLKQWADSGLDLIPFVIERFDICNFPSAQSFVNELMKSGQAIVLFDGLDEVNQENGLRDKQTRALNDFIEKYDRTQCLVTCRIAASDYSFKPFTYVEIADFTPKQIKQFVGNWFHKDHKTRDKFFLEFDKEENKGLRELARAPLLLTLLCLAFDETLTFPQRRVEIYEEAVDALLKKWDSSRRIKRDEVYRKLSLGHKENMLARIAAQTFERNEYFIPQSYLERLISEYVKNVPPHDINDAADGEVILKAIEAQHGIFVERARQVYSFSHLTFQEYFTAKYIVSDLEPTTLKNLVNAHFTDSRWREVFLLTTSLLPDASQLMNTLRRFVDDLIRGDDKLEAVLTWANDVTSSRRNDWKSRLSYLFVDLLYETENDELTASFDHAIDFDHDLRHAIQIAVDDVEDHKDDYQYDIDLEIDIALDLSLYYARLIFEPGHVQVARGISIARSRAHELGLEDFANALSVLQVPTETATRIELKELSKSLRTVMRKYRNIGRKWNLTVRQERQFANYLNATALLTYCLELAFMPPGEKSDILNSLYLPPSSNSQSTGN